MKKPVSLYLALAIFIGLSLCACSRLMAPAHPRTASVRSALPTESASPAPSSSPGTAVTDFPSPGLTPSPGTAATPFVAATAMPVFPYSKLQSSLPKLEVWPPVKVTSRPTSAPAPGQKIAYLTFDDGPTDHALKPTSGTANLLKVLKRWHIHGTFFMVGANVLANPRLARLVVADGNIVGDHTWSHSNMQKVKGKAFELEVTYARKEIFDVTGVKTNLLRPPGGFRPDGTQMKFIRSLGMKVFYWNVDTRDWAGSPDDAILAKIQQGIDTGKNLVILFHDFSFGALDQAIDLLQANGYTFDTLDHFTGFKIGLAET